MVNNWDVELNGCAAPSNSVVKKTCDEQYFFVCKCGMHKTLRTLQSIYRDHPDGVECKICSGRGDSYVELCVRSALLCVDEELVWTVYDKVLRGRHGSVDMWLPKPLDLVIAVHGQGHVDKSCRSTGLQEQLHIDEEMVQACWSQGRRLLVLHYRDIELRDTCGYLQQALQWCRHQPPQKFISYSKRFLLLGYQPKFARL